MTGMIPVTTRSPVDHLVRWPREIAAAVTLPAAAAALVAPTGGPFPRPARIAVTTASAALSTRLALLAFLAAPGRPSARAVRPFDPFSDPMPDALLGVGPMPEADRVRTAGDRCAEVWRAWRADDPEADSASGVAGALAVSAWCAWALGSSARAETRARYAIDLRADDPLAGLVLRTVLAGSGPMWEHR